MNRQMNKEDVVYIYSVEYYSAICNSVDGRRDHDTK